MVVPDLIVLILAIVIAALIIQSRRAPRGAAAPDPAELQAAQLRDEVQQLRERIQVLERVVTDNHGSTDLVQEIERLRDR